MNISNEPTPMEKFVALNAGILFGSIILLILIIYGVI